MLPEISLYLADTRPLDARLFRGTGSRLTVWVREEVSGGSDKLFPVNRFPLYNSTRTLEHQETEKREVGLSYKEI